MQSLEVKKDELLDQLTQAKNQGYTVLMDLTAVDFLEPEVHTRLLYFLHNPTTLQRFLITLNLARDEPLPSVSHLWSGAAWYERELFDLFGVLFEGTPTLQRILLPDDWQGHPLRRDYPLTEEPVQFKHGVCPKIPSEIIPHVRVQRQTY